MSDEAPKGRRIRAPSRLVRLYDQMLSGLGFAAGLIMLAITFGIGADVLVRFLTGGGLPWLIDVVEYAMLVATFAGAPWVLRRKGHVAIELFVTALPVGPQRLMRAVAALIGLLVCAVITIVGVGATLEAASRGSLIIKAVVIPEWWTLAVVPAGMALCTVEFVRFVIRAAPVARSAEGG